MAELEGETALSAPPASNLSAASSALTEFADSESAQQDAGDSVMDTGTGDSASGQAFTADSEGAHSKPSNGNALPGDLAAGGSAEDSVSATDSGHMMDEDPPAEPKDSAELPNWYQTRVAARHDALRDAMPAYESAKKYTFNSVYNIPQSGVQTQAIAIPPCSSHLFTGGSDGYIRRYAWYASLRNHPGERHPVLKGYWENLSITAIQARGLLWSQAMEDDPTKIRFGPTGISGATSVPVHSLAVQKDEMYCLAGSAEGVINLYSVRLDEGQCRACLGVTGKGHKRNTPISALALSEGDATLLSGGWDNQLLQWDLNTGECVRDIVGHKNAIATISYRPTTGSGVPEDLVWSPAAGLENSEDLARRPQYNQSAVDTGNDTTEDDNASKVENKTYTSNQSLSTSQRDIDAASPGSYDPLFDDDNEGGTGNAQPSRLQSPNSSAMEATQTTDSTAPSGGLTFPGLNLPASGPTMPSSLLAFENAKAAPNVSIPTPPKLPEVAQPTIPSFKSMAADRFLIPGLTEPDNSDIFLSCSIDGECLVWDRRVKQANIRRLDLPKGCPPWAASTAWSPSGNAVYVGRRNATISVYDLRTSASQTVSLPKSSGRVTALHALRDNRHLLVSSSDTVRLWDLENRMSSIVSSMASTFAGSSAGNTTAGPSNTTASSIGAAGNAMNGASGVSGSCTSILMDAREKYLFAACGNRGWLENGREEIGTFEVEAR